MTQQTFKVGDKVRVRPEAASHGALDGDVLPGEAGTIVQDDGTSYPFKVKSISSGNREYFKAIQLELAAKNWDSLEVGDILIDDGGQERRIFGTTGEIVFLGRNKTSEGGTCRWDDIYTLQRKGWTVMQDFPTDQVTELSVSELEKKLDLTPGTLRVKKD